MKKVRYNNNNGYLRLCIPICIIWLFLALINGKYSSMFECALINCGVLIFMRLIDGDGENHID